MLLDVLTAVHAFVVAVFVVSYWRGLWYLLNEYLEPKNLERSGWLSVAAAAGLASVCWVLIRRAGPSMRASRAWPAWEALYTQLACAAGVFAWRGIWVLEDVYLWPSDNLTSAFVSLVVGVAGLWGLSAMRSAAAAPMVVEYDSVCEPRSRAFVLPTPPGWMARCCESRVAKADRVGARDTKGEGVELESRAVQAAAEGAPP